MVEINDKDIVIKIFMSNSTLVDLSHIDMSSSNLFKLCQCLKNSKLSSNKTEFNLSLCNINDTKFTHLFEAITTLQNEFILILSFNKIENNALNDIKRIFSELIKLKSLILDGTNLRDSGIIQISPHLQLSKTLYHLSLESNHISLEGIKALSKVLPVVTSLKSINLRGNDLSEERAVQELCNAINHSQIEILNLEMTNIQSLSARHIGSLLAQTRTLASLDLSCNHLLAHGVRFIADGMRSNLSLVHLRMAGCFIGLTGLTYLTSSLVDNDTLRSLDLSRIHSSEDSFGEEGGKAIADLLTLNRGITNLNIYWQCIGTKGAISIAVALDSNRTIKTLNLGGNYVAPEGVRRLEQALGLTHKLSNDRPVSSWLGSAPLTPLLLNRHSAYLRRMSNASLRSSSATPQISRGNSFNNGSGNISRANSFNNPPLSRANSASRGSFKDINIPRLSNITPRTSTEPGSGRGSSTWVPLSPNHEAMKNRGSLRSARNSMTDPQSRRRTSQFFESSFTGGATDDFLTKRTSPTSAQNQQNQQFGQSSQSQQPLSSRRRGSNIPMLSTGTGVPLVSPLLSPSNFPASLQGLSQSSISSTDKKKK